MANEAIRVKALEWNAATSFFYAKSPFGPYRVQDCWHWEDKSIAYTSIFAETVIGDFLSLEEAKAACQADFARRVGECVEVDDVGNTDALQARCDKLLKVAEAAEKALAYPAEDEMRMRAQQPLRKALEELNND